MNGTGLAFAPDVVLQIIDGDALILRLHDETVFALNETGARIAQAIASGTPVAEIVHALSGQYGVPAATIESDVTALVDGLHARGLLVHVGPR